MRIPHWRPDIHMAICVVTGANRGIGLELCRQLSARGDHVIAACRQSSPELDDLGVEVVNEVDVGNSESLQQLIAAVGDRNIDLLVNNAGILRRDELATIDDDTIEAMVEQFRVNSIGPVLVTRALAANMSAGSKVGIVSSRMGSVTDNSSGGYYGYRMSKAAVNVAGTSLSIDLAKKGISVFLLHPGYVQTDMTNGQADVVPTVSVRGLLERLDELGARETGSFWHAQGEPLPW
jgi:NAD(P)-dependent dehydrogenase (short-subunit alcohol dehydrogenase family)